MYFEDIKLGATMNIAPAPRNQKNEIVEISVDAYNQNGQLVLTDVTEAIVKRRPL